MSPGSPVDGRRSGRRPDASAWRSTARAAGYDVVVDYAGEGRLSIDGREPYRHGSATRYGPRLTATRLALAAGRHDIELRLATRGGVASFSLFVLPASNADGGKLAPGPLADYCAAAIAQRTEAADDALAAVARLRARPRFALGLALAAAVAHDDPSRPASIARDAARTALRAAVAVDPALARPWNDLAALALEDERPRDAIEAGRAAARAAPGWLAPQLLLARAFTARGLEFDANRARRGGGRRGPGQRPASAVGRALSGDRGAAAARAGPARARAGGAAGVGAEVVRRERRGARRAPCGRGAISRAPSRRCARRCAWIRSATIWSAIWRRCCSASGRHDAALAEMSRLVARDPNDPQRRLRLADAQAAAGQSTAARETIAALLASRARTFPRCSARRARWACRCRSTTFASTAARSSARSRRRRCATPRRRSWCSIAR